MHADLFVFWTGAMNMNSNVHASHYINVYTYRLAKDFFANDTISNLSYSSKTHSWNAGGKIPRTSLFASGTFSITLLPTKEQLEGRDCLLLNSANRKNIK